MAVSVSDSFSLDDEAKDFTWGKLAEMYYLLVGAFGQLTPPQELQAYHDANISVAESIRDHARTRPSEDSFLEEFIAVAFEILGASLEIGLDTTKTEEEKERLYAALEEEKLGELFGPDYVTAALALEEAKAGLPEETLARLDGSSCESLLGLTAEAGDSFEEPGPSSGSFEEPETSIGTLSVGEAPRVGDYRVWLRSYSQNAQSGTTVVVKITGVGEEAVATPNCDRQMSLQGQAGAHYQETQCAWSSPLGGGQEWLYTLIYRTPEDADGLVWKFSAGTVGVEFALEDPGTDVADDHGDDIGSATTVTVGEAIEGTLNYDGDVDVFGFHAEEGEIYQVDVAQGTLYDSSLALYDVREQFLSFSNDLGENQAPRIVWKAPASGSFYVEASNGDSCGFDPCLGSYTLTVALSDITDDHSDGALDATAVTVGEAVEGELNYFGDVDFFGFQAQQGEFYQIDVVLGTLGDSALDLYDAGEMLIESNDNHEDSLASRIVWRAPDSGHYYVEVSAGGWVSASGSYTLTVGLSDITDDHGDTASEATVITGGEALSGTAELEDDTDVFHFQTEPGQLYWIDLAQGSPAGVGARLYDEPDEWNAQSPSSIFRVTGHWNIWSSEEETVYIVVRPVNGESSSYTLKVEKIAPETIWIGNTDYDTDDDGLIEVSSLAQLNAIRWDLDGDGLPDGASAVSGYTAAFQRPADRMGCPDGKCSGYELTSSLDFDTNGNGSPDSGDTYWNEGQGWEPIGRDIETEFVASFDGGGHTISNLYIDRRDAENVGLFGIAGSDGSRRFVGLKNNIRNVALIDISINGGRKTGGLVGDNGLTIAASYVTGSVNGSSNVGGLAGANFSGTIIASYSTASVSSAGQAGGLVGSNFGGTVIASYSTGSVTSEIGDAGGLVRNSFVRPDSVRYSYWDTETSGLSESVGGEGKTTSELQSPAGYSGIYERWDVDLDGDGAGDDLWDFGTASQYPVLKRVGIR